MNEYQKVINALNELPEFFHKGKLCVEIDGVIYEKEAVAKTIRLFFNVGI